MIFHSIILLTKASFVFLRDQAFPRTKSFSPESKILCNKVITRQVVYPEALKQLPFLDNL